MKYTITSKTLSVNFVRTYTCLSCHTTLAQRRSCQFKSHSGRSSKSIGINQKDWDLNMLFKEYNPVK